MDIVPFSIPRVGGAKPNVASTGIMPSPGQQFCELGEGLLVFIKLMRTEIRVISNDNRHDLHLKQGECSVDIPCPESDEKVSG